MKKRRIVYLAFFVLLQMIIVLLFLSKKVPFDKNEPVIQNNKPHIVMEEPKKIYEVYYFNQLQQSFELLNEAVAYAKTMESSSVRKQGDSQLYWHNYAAFTVHQNGKFISDFDMFNEAVTYAKKYEGTKVYFQLRSTPVWEHKQLPLKISLIDAPLISQMPELARGCEVTSLAMLLQYAGVDTDKMKLAEEIKKDPTRYERKNGAIYFGNPYDGFVGDIYTFSKPGYGVYHGPIKELAEKYMPGQIIDMTGSEFEDILFALEREVPVWVIHNSWFSRLPDSQFQTWETPSGPVKITYREHSVLVTGYDDKYVYFNDPLANVKNRKVPFDAFKEGWDQMGKQAISYVEGHELTTVNEINSEEGVLN